MIIGALAAILAPPARAHDLSSNGGCRDRDAVVGVALGDSIDRNGDLAACLTPNGRFRDNHFHDNGGGWTADGCREGDTLVGVLPGDPADLNGDLAVCRASDGSSYDNR